jgi:hypothetical protein
VSGSEGLSPAKRELLERALRRRREAAAAADTRIPRRRPGEPVPLSFSQQRIWFLQQWEPDAPTFNGARAIRLRGLLDIKALERSLRSVVERQESLRTVVVPGRDPTQKVLEDWSFELEVRTQGQDLGDLLRQLCREPFDLTKDLMLRATLVALGAGEHVLLLRMHHIAADAHSDRVLFSELSELYAAGRTGRAPNLPALPIQYLDFAVWQHDRLQGPLLERLRSYWAKQLEGAPPILRLPTDRPRRPVQRHEGAHHPLSLDRALADELVAVGRSEGATFFMTMLAAFATLLYRLSGEPDIVVGSPIANRNNVEVEGLIGFFTNTIALRTSLAGNPSFRQVLSRAQQAALGAYAHQDLPFEKVVETVRPKRDPSYNPLFQVNFRAQEAQRRALVLDGMRTELIPVDIGFSRFDFALELELREDALVGYFEYDCDLFDQESVAGFAEDLGSLLAQVAAAPDVPILAIQLRSGRKPAAVTGARIARRPTSPRHV